MYYLIHINRFNVIDLEQYLESAGIDYGSHPGWVGLFYTKGIRDEDIIMLKLKFPKIYFFEKDKKWYESRNKNKQG